MRLERVGSAVAIILVVLATAPPPAIADASPAATIVSPADGATVVGTTLTVRIHYADHSGGAKSIMGHLTLDGAALPMFQRNVTGSPSNGTTFNATLDLSSVASGAHALGASVGTELDAPIEAPAITIVVDKPPTIEVLNVSYDLDARELSVTAEVADDADVLLAVQLSAGKNATNASFLGVGVVTLHAPRGPGTYPASLSATDASKQSARRNFNFTVADREAALTVSHAAYELGGKLRVRGNVSDPDGDVTSVHVKTSLGSGMATIANGTWSALVNVTPRLGTFNGTAYSRDAWGGITGAPFSFTIGGPNETIFERTVTTEIGAYADAAHLKIPRVLGGAIEICVDGCAGAPSTTASATLYNATCGGFNYQGNVCRQLTGRPGFPGSFDVCWGASQDLLSRTLSGAVRAANNATGGQICSSAFDELNATERATLESLGLSPVGQPAPGVAIAIRSNDSSSNNTSPDCVATNDRTCLFEAPSGTSLDLSWLQGAGHTVSVRIRGVRV